MSAPSVTPPDTDRRDKTKSRDKNSGKQWKNLCAVKILLHGKPFKKKMNRKWTFAFVSSVIFVASSLGFFCILHFCFPSVSDETDALERFSHISLTKPKILLGGGDNPWWKSSVRRDIWNEIGREPFYYIGFFHGILSSLGSFRFFLLRPVLKWCRVTVLFRWCLFDLPPFCKWPPCRTTDSTRRWGKLSRR